MPPSSQRHLPANPNRTVEHRPEHLREIVLAGGHFWGVEAFLARIYGVAATQAGYANGSGDSTSYNATVYEQGDHALAVRVRYDETLLSLEALLEQFFRIIDPTSSNHQGHDWGRCFRSGIYYIEPSDIPAITAAFERVRRRSSEQIATEFRPLETWVPAEQFHQQHLEKHPDAYCSVDLSLLPLGPLARPEALDLQRRSREATFRRPDTETLRELLTPQQFKVTQEGATEAPFRNAYHDNERPGLYIDVTTGEPLFSSDAKYDSGSGWPSFTRPLHEDLLDEYEDMRFDRSRIEVRSRLGDSHLGHVFDDGPADRGGRRYCINSAALRFIPYEELEAEGYGAWRTAVNPDRDQPAPEDQA
ncbi:MAG: peptide-methionine (R)-S-oxide reductase MsrB [Bacillota bacterium]|nr:peptide-methionine (R)-S-oxide reductase MsrB [Bacillota bacterium]